MGQRGEFRDRAFQDQVHRASCLHLLIAAIGAWNTPHIAAAIEQLRAEGEYEDTIRKRLALKHGCVPEVVHTILRLNGEMPEWVFINEAGKQLEHNNYRRRVFEPLLQKAGLRRIRFHDLRHTFASLLLQQGESPQYVREQMGHHSIQITVDITGTSFPEPTGRRSIGSMMRRTLTHPPRTQIPPDGWKPLLST